MVHKNIDRSVFCMKRYSTALTTIKLQKSHSIVNNIFTLLNTTKLITIFFYIPHFQLLVISFHGVRKWSWLNGCALHALRVNLLTNHMRLLKWVRIRDMVFYATFNNISVILWRSVLLVEEAGVPGEKHRPVASHWQTLSHNVVLNTPHHEWGSNSQC